MKDKMGTFWHGPLAGQTPNAKDINPSASQVNGEITVPNAAAVRAEMLRRYAAPFVFNPRGPGGQKDEAPSVLKQIKRIAIMIGGGTVLATGVAMIVLPGPAFLVIPAGLAILALEYAWARRLLRSFRAILPKRHQDHPAPHKTTLKSVRRSLEFLFRQVRRVLAPKRFAP